MSNDQGEGQQGYFTWRAGHLLSDPKHFQEAPSLFLHPHPGVSGKLSFASQYSSFPFFFLPKLLLHLRKGLVSSEAGKLLLQDHAFCPTPRVWGETA